MKRRVDEMMKAQYEDRRLKPIQDQVQPQPQKCPRCDSINTKFCYYNNYSLSQPRYLCKSCRRYWTQGGTLRNVPVGGGCRKGNRAKQSPRSSNTMKLQTPPQIVPPSLATSSEHVIFSGTPVITPSLVFSPGVELPSSSSWVNSFGSSQGQGQIQAPEIIYETMDQLSVKTALTSSSSAGWPESYITNSISNPMAAPGDAMVWKGGKSNAATVPANPTNNSAAINQWPDYTPGFYPPP